MVVSHAHADQEFWEIDRDLAKELNVDVATLEEKLGVDTSAESNWYVRMKKECDSRGTATGLCSLRGRTLRELKETADQGSPFVQNDYAYNLSLRNDSAEALKESFQYALKAAEAGLPHAQVTVGWRLLHGIGVERDAKAAFDWNLKGARQGHPEGANNVAFQYQYGIGVTQSRVLAENWYSYAAIKKSLIAWGSLLQMRRDEK